MRVLHIGKFFPPHPGGIERVCADLCAGLQQHGCGTALVAHAEPGTHRTFHRYVAGVDVTLVACHGRWLYAPVSPGFVFALNAAIRRFRPDLLHIHVPNTSAFWALLSSSARHLPWVVHWHADIPSDGQHFGLRLGYRVYRPWEQALLRRARAVIATSGPYLESSKALAPWRDKSAVIPLGLPSTDNATDDAPSNSAKTQRIDWPGTGLRLLAVGRLSYFKGFDVLLRAMAEVPDAGLVLVGEGECGPSLRRLSRTLGIAERVKFAGRIEMDASGAGVLSELYRRADVFCLPSTERAESFGLVLLEAMRARTAVIASDIPGSGIGFVVRHEETGLLVPPGDAERLAAAILRLATDAGLRNQLGESGQARWREEFTLDRCVQQTLALYRQLLETPRRDTAASTT